MNEFLTNLKRNVQENPVVNIGVAAAAITATAKLIDTVAGPANSRSYAKEVNRRVKKANQK
jgi:hypothetical protein